VVGSERTFKCNFFHILSGIRRSTSAQRCCRSLSSCSCPSSYFSHSFHRNSLWTPMPTLQWIQSTTFVTENVTNFCVFNFVLDFVNWSTLFFNYGIWSRAVFGLFETVINNNRACRALSGDIGTCLSYPECFAFRGNISGTCGRGYGLCCVSKLKYVLKSFNWLCLSQNFLLFFVLATKTCQGVIYANNTYFVNQGYPGSYTSAGQCYTTVNRLAPNICQLRLYQ
jgi:hypothetical protein